MREKLIELIQTASSTCPDGIHKCPDCEYYGKDAFGKPCNDQKRIADVLIANGVTIHVRCKDCKHWQESVDGIHKWCPLMMDKETKPDDFCSHGERKKE